MGCLDWLILFCWAFSIFADASLPLSTGPLSTSKIRSLLQSNSTLRFQKPYNVCTSDWAPIVMCADIENQADYSGFQIALWREIASDLGWADSDWTFSCVDWTAMIDDLIDPNGLCSFAAAGVEVSLSNIVAGLKFSWPIYKSGFHVLIASHVEEGGMWAFAEAFHWSVWVVLGATAIISSFLVTAIEAFTCGNHANRKGLRGWSWYAMGKMVQVPTHVGDPKTWASRVLVLGYAFLALIMVHLFTATTASKMTMQRLANDITSKADLPGKKVESWEPYVPLLRKYSIDADALPWDNDADTQVMLANLRSRKYQALILDSPVVQYFAAIAEQCDLYPVGDPWETFNLAIAFPPNTPDQLPANISASIVRMQTTSAILDQLENEYVKSAHAVEADGSMHTCTNVYTDSTQSHTTDPQINIDQVLGLWYILLITLGIAVIIVAVQHVVWKRKELRGWVGRVTGGFSGRVAPEAAAQAAAVDDEDATAAEEDDLVASITVAMQGKEPAGELKTRQAAVLAAELAPIQSLPSPHVPGQVGSAQ